MTTINIEDLYKKQADLDAYIAKNHNVTYETTFPKRLLALLVELGELANETRVFKYWSNKKSSPREVILDEYADAFHFLLSLGIYLKPTKFIYKYEGSAVDISDQFVSLYHKASELRTHYDLAHYEETFSAFFSLGASLELTSEEVVNAYLKKLEKNYNRQDTGY